MTGFWTNRRVFVTGHTGFKGAWLALWLRQLGANVTGYALAPPTTPSLFEAADVGAGMESIVGDLGDYPRLTAALGDASPEIVIHLAAQALVRASLADPVETYRTNVMGTVHLLQAIREVGNVRAMLNVTSDKCYQDQEWVWGYRENDRLGGRDPYSSSKACAELVSAAFRDSFFPIESHASHGLALATARAGNVIGGGDWARDRLVPDILAAVSANRVAEIRSPTAVRPWQHVLEPLSGYLTLAERLVTDGPTFSGAWNFGPDQRDSRTVAWIADRLTGLWSPQARWATGSSPAAQETNALRLDSSKSGQRLGWRPRWDLQTALTHTVSWHRGWLAGENIAALTLAQIADFAAGGEANRNRDA